MNDRFTLSLAYTHQQRDGEWRTNSRLSSSHFDCTRVAHSRTSRSYNKGLSDFHWTMVLYRRRHTENRFDVLDFYFLLFSSFAFFASRRVRPMRLSEILFSFISFIRIFPVVFASSWSCFSLSAYRKSVITTTFISYFVGWAMWTMMSSMNARSPIEIDEKCKERTRHLTENDVWRLKAHVWVFYSTMQFLNGMQSRQTQNDEYM